MPTLTANVNATGFLSRNNYRPPRLYVTAESDDFDQVTLRDWRNEGFNVAYVPMGDGGKEYAQRLESLSRAELGVGETFAIIAYGDAASFCLEHYARPTGAAAAKLSALIAYYPSEIPDSTPGATHFPGHVRVLVHLAGSTIGVRRNQQLLGIQGKRRTIRKHLTPGIGTGGSLYIAYPTYTYQDAVPGFAEHDLDEYERVATELSWARTLEVLRWAFGRNVDLESVWEENVQNKFYGPTTSKSSSSVENRASGIIDTLMTSKTPHVTHTPTLTGGIGAAELHRFYADFFLPSSPPSLHLRLLSRTIGADRIIDELYVSFQHSQVMPWILPDIPATNKMVEVIVISIVCMRGGKLYHEHVYWDQASVLVQVGLLNPHVVPEWAKGEGVKRLPVVGREAARSILNVGDEEGEVRNELIPGWREGAPFKVKGAREASVTARQRKKPEQGKEEEEEEEGEEGDEEEEGEEEEEEGDEEGDEESDEEGDEEGEEGAEEGEEKREEAREEDKAVDGEEEEGVKREVEGKKDREADIAANEAGDQKQEQEEKGELGAPGERKVQKAEDEPEGEGGEANTIKAEQH